MTETLAKTVVVQPWRSQNRTGRDNFYVAVRAKNDCTVVLDVHRTVRDAGHGDFGFEKSFGLQLIWVFPSYVERDTYPLFERMPFEKLNDYDFLKANEDVFIESIEEREGHNYPLDEAALARLSDDEFVRFWNDPNNAPHMTYAITVTDAGWIEQLAVGLDYESCAIDID